jgi:hypothetical protein
MTPEKLVSKLKMSTGIEAKIEGEKLIVDSDLTMTECDNLVKFCHKHHLNYELTGTYQFIIN